MVSRFLILSMLFYAMSVLAEEGESNEWGESSNDSFLYSAALGVSQNKVKTLLEGGDRPAASTSDWRTGPFIGLGVHGVYSGNHELGLTVSYSTADGDALWAFRPFDYRYALFDQIRLKAFFGVARYDQATAAHGYYLGTGVEWRPKAWPIGLHVEAAYGDKLARDRVLPDDPPSVGTPEIFYDLYLVNTYLTWYF